MRPTHPMPLLLKFASGSKAVSLKGGKGSPEEAVAFLKKLKNTRGGGRCCLSGRRGADRGAGRARGAGPRAIWEWNRW